ncbi:MAG: DUF1508 domain-containing protein [Bacteroidetes bacterium]|nr:MAG: DUF1508 domain-containing protein [Bacteroidota bacterium]
MIVIKKSRNGQYYFIAKSRNGRTLVTSETYKRRDRCRNGATSLTKLLRGSLKVIYQTKK